MKREGICGNDMCEIGERCDFDVANSDCCAQDCPYSLEYCPVPSGSSTPCGGHGNCLIAQGSCECYGANGYTGADCSECLPGFTRFATPEGEIQCIPEVVIQFSADDGTSNLDIILILIIAVICLICFIMICCGTWIHRSHPTFARSPPLRLKSVTVELDGEIGSKVIIKKGYLRKKANENFLASLACCFFGPWYVRFFMLMRAKGTTGSLWYSREMIPSLFGVIPLTTRKSVALKNIEEIVPHPKNPARFSIKYTNITGKSLEMKLFAHDASDARDWIDIINEEIVRNDWESDNEHDEDDIPEIEVHSGDDIIGVGTRGPINEPSKIDEEGEFIGSDNEVPVWHQNNQHLENLLDEPVSSEGDMGDMQMPDGNISDDPTVEQEISMLMSGGGNNMLPEDDSDEGKNEYGRNYLLDSEENPQQDDTMLFDDMQKNIENALRNPSSTMGSSQLPRPTTARSTNSRKSRSKQPILSHTAFFPNSTPRDEESRHNLTTLPPQTTGFPNNNSSRPRRNKFPSTARLASRNNNSNNNRKKTPFASLVPALREARTNQRPITPPMVPPSTNDYGYGYDDDLLPRPSSRKSHRRDPNRNKNQEDAPLSPKQRRSDETASQGYNPYGFDPMDMLGDDDNY
eukprot:TRINITY_DN14909_c1_g2_i6.p1 TRINITY_DN14909_c1_g2~~TRINITY_DN14909_c1_g2_i6.p1  ORF type:complete len:632 (-),score=219.60 TRINITY_DN14909_c1_g2_i6:166-2061(-)